LPTASIANLYRLEPHQTVLPRADAAGYEAKHRGRNAAVVHRDHADRAPDSGVL